MSTKWLISLKCFISSNRNAFFLWDLYCPIGISYFFSWNVNKVTHLIFVKIQQSDSSHSNLNKMTNLIGMLYFLQNESFFLWNLFHPVDFFWRGAPASLNYHQTSLQHGLHLNGLHLNWVHQHGLQIQHLKAKKMDFTYGITLTWTTPMRTAATRTANTTHEIATKMDYTYMQ